MERTAATLLENILKKEREKLLYRRVYNSGDNVANDVR